MGTSINYHYLAIFSILELLQAIAERDRHHHSIFVAYFSLFYPYFLQLPVLLKLIYIEGNDAGNKYLEEKTQNIAMNTFKKFNELIEREREFIYTLNSLQFRNGL